MLVIPSSCRSCSWLKQAPYLTLHKESNEEASAIDCSGNAGCVYRLWWKQFLWRRRQSYPPVDPGYSRGYFRGGWHEPVVQGHRNVQRRQHSGPYRFRDLDFFQHRRGYDQKWRGHHLQVAGSYCHHGKVAWGIRYQWVDRHRGSVHFDLYRGRSSKSVRCCRAGSAVHGDWDLQRWPYPRPNQFCILEFIRYKRCVDR